MDLKHKQKWEKVRAKDRKRFVSLYGVVIPVSIAVLLAALVIIFWPYHRYTDEPSKGILPLLIILLPLLAVAIPFSVYQAGKMWDSTEKEYLAFVGGEAAGKQTDKLIDEQPTHGRP